MKNSAVVLLAFAMASVLSACATRGPLELPPGPAPEPLFGRSQPASPTPKNLSPSDVSTDLKARPQ